MNNMIHQYGLRVAQSLVEFIEDEALPGTGIDREAFWQGFSSIAHQLAPRNRALLVKRDRLQKALDDWHRAHPGPVRDMAAYRAFLEEIGYLAPAAQRVRVTTEGVDGEIADQAGPQLVVPLSNARYALNAANARWGSLYDALYGTDALPEDGGATRGAGYNPVRGARVIAYARAFLDNAAPLASGSHSDVDRYEVRDGQLVASTATGETTLTSADQFAGFRGDPHAPGHLVEAQRPAHRNSNRCLDRHRPHRSRRCDGRAARSGDHHHHRLRGFGRRRGRGR